MAVAAVVMAAGALWFIFGMTWHKSVTRASFSRAWSADYSRAPTSFSPTDLAETAADVARGVVRGVEVRDDELQRIEHRHAARREPGPDPDPQHRPAAVTEANR